MRDRPIADRDAGRRLAVRGAQVVAACGLALATTLGLGGHDFVAPEAGGSPTAPVVPRPVAQAEPVPPDRVERPSARTPQPTGTAHRPPAAPAEPWAPVSIEVPALGVDAPVTAYTDAMVAAAGGWVDPSSSTAAAWWTGGGTPGPHPTNTVYVYGHVSGRGAVFDRLHDARPGETVRLTTARGTVTYRVTQVLAPVMKSALPDDPRVNVVSPGRLVLITCYRAPDQGRRPTTHNTVVLAEQVR